MTTAFTTIFLKYILMPLLMLVTVFIFSIANKGKKVLKLKRLIIFVLLSSLFIAVPVVFLGLMEIQFYPLGLFLTHLYFFLFGFALVQFTYTDLFNSIGFKDNVLPFVISILFSSLIGAWLYYIIFDWINDLDYTFYIVLGVVWVVMPILLKWAEDFFAEIPPKIYKLWYPKGGKDYMNWETIDLRRLKEVTVRIRKNPEDESYSNVDAKIPEGVTLGQWFNRFIEDHDVKFPDTPISLSEEGEGFYGWVFYRKRWIPLLNTPIDFELSLDKLKLSDKSTIIVKRVVHLDREDNSFFDSIYNYEDSAVKQNGSPNEIGQEASVG